MAERRRRRALAVRRWPVRWRLAAVSATLTMLILLVFAFVVGRLAADRIEENFDDEVMATASEVRTQMQLDQAGINAPAGRDLLDLLMAGDAAVRIAASSDATAGSAAGTGLTAGDATAGSATGAGQ